MTNEFLDKLSTSPTFAAIGVAFIILMFGFQLLTRMKADSPLAPYGLQIFALVVILPVVLALALATKFPMEAVTGLLGTVVGFFFGGAHGGHHNAPSQRQPAAEAQGQV